MLGRKDAEAIEAYARECETRAKQAIERRVVPPLAICATFRRVGKGA
jgi:hypothetical protein